MKKIDLHYSCFYAHVDIHRVCNYAEQRKDTYDMRKEVGNSQFVGSSNNLDARGMMKGGWW